MSTYEAEVSMVQDQVLDHVLATEVFAADHKDQEGLVFHDTNGLLTVDHSQIVYQDSFTHQYGCCWPVQESYPADLMQTGNMVNSVTFSYADEFTQDDKVTTSSDFRPQLEVHQTQQGGKKSSKGGKKSSSAKVRRRKKSSYKHVPHAEKPAHLVAKRNARERKRVHAVNLAFVRLRKAMPFENKRGKRVSKVKVLQKAITYITKLREMIWDFDHDDRGAGDENQEEENCLFEF